MITPVQKQDFFSGFDDIDSNGTEMTDMKNKNATYVDVDEGVNFPLLGGPQKHRDYSTIKIDSDHGSGTSRDPSSEYLVSQLWFKMKFFRTRRLEINCERRIRNGKW